MASISLRVSSRQSQTVVCKAQSYLASSSLLLHFLPGSPHPLGSSHISFSTVARLSHVEDASSIGSPPSGLCLQVSLSVMLSLLSYSFCPLLAFINSFPDFILILSPCAHLTYYLLFCLIVYYISLQHSVSSLSKNSSLSCSLLNPQSLESCLAGSKHLVCTC